MMTDYSLPPFPPFPSATRYIELGAIEEAIERVKRSIESREGISLIIGPPGTGKSLACNVLVDQFSETHDVAVLGELPISDAAAFYRRLLHHLGVDFASVPDGDLHLRLVDQIRQDDSKEGLVVVVDEAQSLTAEVLEAIRMTTNITRAGQPCVSAVVCGGVRLEETLAAAAMEPFSQRVATRCYLHPMNAAETRYYIRETIARCGCNPEDTITDEAMGAIHHACNGVPRLINQMMSEAIECAADAEQTVIDEQTIDRAWAQLQQLPSPMVNEQKIEHNVAPVEFGSLDDSFEPAVDNRVAIDEPVQEASLEIETGELTVAETEGGSAEPDASEPDANEVDANEPVAVEFGELDSDDGKLADNRVDAKAEPEIDTAEEGDEEPAAIELAEVEVAPPQVAALEHASPISFEESLEAELELAIDEEARLEPEQESRVIEFASESATIVWSDDPEEPLPAADAEEVASIADVPAASPLPTALFGEFAQEESLNVGVGIAQPSLAPATVATTVIASPTPVNSPVNSPVAEAIAPVAVPAPVADSAPEEVTPAQATPTQTLQPEPAVHQLEESLHNDVINLNEMATQARFGGIDPGDTFGEPVWTEEVDVMQQNTTQQCTTQQNTAEQCTAPPADDEPIWFTEPTGDSEPEVIRDDSDLLIIEDELDVVPRPRKPRPVESQQQVKVDFQSMLARMRAGS